MKYLFFIAITIFLVNCKAPEASSVTSDASTPTESNDNFIENNPKALINQTYKVTLLKDGDALYAFPKKQPKVTFGEEGKLSTQLSANKCGGSYEVDTQKISFSADACTEMCCDSKEDKVFQGLLNKGTFDYKMTTKEVLLTNGNTTIRLLLVEN